MQRWQYQRLVIETRGFLTRKQELWDGEKTLKGNEVVNYLDTLGQSGWELVAASSYGPQGRYWEILWFKRLVE